MLKFLMRRLLLAGMVFAAAFCCCGADPVAIPVLGQRTDFSDAAELRDNWRFYGRLMVPAVDFRIRNYAGASGGGVLVIESNSASGVLVTNRFDVDPEKYPILHWRWRILAPVTLPDCEAEPDDQAAVVYVGDGPFARRRAVGYRWEKRTPPGEVDVLHYNGGLVKVRPICLRNQDTPTGEWVEETRNYYKDFKAAFGWNIERPFALSIGANTQHSSSNTVVEIDYIEFLPEQTENGKK